ncbi:HAD-IIB family hydrolase [Candidatus Dojkabacteria bacterium]|nr:HAD-IIB family hydrolase [Candidatus Dojkabacteria bacterium]
MIQAIILDIDGVLIGSKNGFNYPKPNPKVIEMLKIIQENKIQIILCTAKPMVATKELIKYLDLENIPFISDNGAIVYSPKSKKLSIYYINRDIAKKIIKDSIESNIYTEINTTKNYYIDTAQQSNLTDILTELRGIGPMKVDNLQEIINNEKIVRVSLFTLQDYKTNIEKRIQNYDNHIDFKWSYAPKLGSYWAAVLTCKNISKKSGLLELVKVIPLNLQYTLGVGDGMNDWDFISECSYKATLANGHKNLKKKIMRYDNSCIGSHVDQNGLIDIFQYYKLL